MTGNSSAGQQIEGDDVFGAAAYNENLRNE